MKYALINPNWTFEGSTYFGCREPHLPIEYGYAKTLLEKQGHEAIIIDAQLNSLSAQEIQKKVTEFQPDFTVITTAPSYLFWRCAPPELRIPQETLIHLKNIDTTFVAIGPHASTTPTATLKKLGVDVVILGECEEILPQLPQPWKNVSSICYWKDNAPILQGSPHTTDLGALPALHWEDATIQRHPHHHHRFDAPPQGYGAEMETSRGCPYHCSFCAKENFRNSFRKRPLEVILEELDRLIAQGVEYVYFVDEIFLPNRALLEALVKRKIIFGVQTRIDLWKKPLIDLLGKAGCVSIEAGVESITEEGRSLLNKNCKLSTNELSERLVYAKTKVPFVQANLLDSNVDDIEAIASWRNYLIENGVWANKPVPLFPYPGSPDYTKKWGFPDEKAWERANQYYLKIYAEFSDIQEQQPLPLSELELNPIEV
ncbi:MAG: TIGR04295 family B12-binding domain-containing radical SAM protein [Chroococcales cyanobacterium]